MKKHYGDDYSKLLNEQLFGDDPSLLNEVGGGEGVGYPTGEEGWDEPEPEPQEDPSTRVGKLMQMATAQLQGAVENVKILVSDAIANGEITQDQYEDSIYKQMQRAAVDIYNDLENQIPWSDSSSQPKFWHNEVSRSLKELANDIADEMTGNVEDTHDYGADYDLDAGFAAN